MLMNKEPAWISLVNTPSPNSEEICNAENLIIYKLFNFLKIFSMTSPSGDVVATPVNVLLHLVSAKDICTIIHDHLTCIEV